MCGGCCNQAPAFVETIFEAWEVLNGEITNEDRVSKIKDDLHDLAVSLVSTWVDSSSEAKLTIEYFQTFIDILDD